MLKLESSRRVRLLALLITGISIVAIMVIGLALQNTLRPRLPAKAEIYDIEMPTATATDLAWPSYGQAAIATKDYGVLELHGDTGAQPTASIAKLITMLAILEEKPLGDDQGDTITFTEADVELHNYYVAGNGTNTPVYSGLKWTQYQALQAVLHDSSNNVSDSLAIWAFGSLEGYRDYAQAMVERFGMKDTVIGIDASGYSPTTTSTAHDIALLAQYALDNPTIRDIANQPSSNLSGAGLRHNTSWINDSEIIGLKNGFLPEAGGVFVLVGVQSVDGEEQEIITVVMGAPGGPSMAMRDARALYYSAKDHFSFEIVVSSGQKIGQYRPSWLDQPVAIVAERDLRMFVWAGLSPTIKAEAQDLEFSYRGVVGGLTVDYGEWRKEVDLAVY